MRHFVPIAASCLLLAASLPAPAQNNQPDLAALPEVIKNLQWKAIDPAALTPVERCRVLAFMNDALDDIGAQVRAEADLMSAFIEQKNLGPEFAGSPPPENPSPLTYDDGVKISVAMLRGPLAQSSYATDYQDSADPTFIAATVGLFDSSSRRKWSEVVEGRTQVRWMTRYLQDSKLDSEFQAWVPAEVQRREQEYQAQMDQQRAAAAEKRQAQKAAQSQKQREEEARQEAEAQKAQEQQLAASQQMQQAMGAAQTQQLVVSPNDDYDDDSYAGYGAVTYLGTSPWYRDGAYRGAAGARVDHRMSGWNKAARGRRR